MEDAEMMDKEQVNTGTKEDYFSPRILGNYTE